MLQHGEGTDDDRDERQQDQTDRDPLGEVAGVDLLQRRAGQRLVAALDVASDEHDRTDFRQGRSDRRDRRSDDPDPGLAQGEGPHLAP